MRKPKNWKLADLHNRQMVGGRYASKAMAEGKARIHSLLNKVPIDRIVAVYAPPGAPETWWPKKNLTMKP